MSERRVDNGGAMGGLLGQTVPADSGRRGASPKGGAWRLVAALPHLLVTLGILLTGFAAISLQDTGGRFMAGLLPFLLSIIALRAGAFILRGMAPEARYHALQASWWYVAMALVLGILGLVATGLGAAAFFLGALVVAVPSTVAAWRVLAGQGHRYPFISDRMETGERVN